MTLVSSKLKPLIIPNNKTWKGVTVVCGKCRCPISDMCKELNEPIGKCPNGDRHYFKVLISVPGTKNARKTKNLKTRDINEAIKQAIEFEKEVKENRAIQQIRGRENRGFTEPVLTNLPTLLIKAFARYVGWLNNEAVPAHLQRERSQEHIKDVKRALKTFVQCLKNSGIDTSTLTVEGINDEIVGIIFSYLEKKFSNRTFNKYFSYYTSFLKFYAEEYNTSIRNWFERVKRKTLNPKPQAITKEEYEALLKQITPENGVRFYEGVKEKRSFYRPWLADAFRLALETGRRREEVVKIKWNLIDESEGVITIEDFKVNRIQHRKAEDEKKLIHIPLTPVLKELLIELGYERFKGSDEYILAPNEKISRNKVMCDILSRGFSHFYNQLGTGRNLTFKDLRKTYITGMQLHMGDNSKYVTGHTSDGVKDLNYINKKKIAKSGRDAKVFEDESTRESELTEFRMERKKDQQRDLNI